MNLYAHQIEAIEIAAKGNVALFHDCGVGKTLSALHIIREHRHDGPALVVCPISIIEEAWISDCKKFTPELSIVSLWSKKTAMREVRLEQDADIYVANYETLKSLYRLLQAKGFGTLIVDESSRMKSPKTQITKALLSFAGIKFRRSPYKTVQCIKHRYVLSGTPAPNHEGEYWAQIKFITGPGNKGFNDNYYAFRAKYFAAIMLGLSGARMYKFRKSMREELIAEMKPYCHIVRTEDVLDLPEQIHQIRRVFLNGEEAKAYADMKRDLVLSFANETILSSNALVEIMKLRQLTSGFIYGEEGTHQTGKSKINELTALLDELGDNQAIIWINFREEAQQIQKLYPDSAALWGNVKDRNAEIQRFKSGEARLLIANPQSAAHGLSFNNCRYAIYFSLNYSSEMQKQSQKRIHGLNRGIAGKHSTYYYLIADKTVDELIYKTVLAKGELSRSVLGWLKGE